MTTTIPPGGKSAQGQFGAPVLKPTDFPHAVVWTIEYRDGRVTHGINSVLSQTALNELYRILKNEEKMFRVEVTIKLTRMQELSVSPMPLRSCDVIQHNRKGTEQDLYCHECGRRTRILKIVDRD